MRTAITSALLLCSVSSAQPSIVISDGGIVLNGKLLGITAARLLRDESAELVEAIARQRALAPDAGPCGQLQAPGSASFGMIRKVIRASATAGCTSVGLSEGPAEPARTVSTVDVPSKTVAVAVTVTPTQLRLSVGGSVDTPIEYPETMPQAFIDRLQELRKALPAQKGVTLQIDDAVPFGRVLPVLDTLLKAELSQLVLADAQDSGAAAPMAMGTLDKALIRKVILANGPQVKACYEKVLAHFPKLDGKASIKFVISASGTISSAVVESATNAELGSCIAERVRTWQFPKPSGDGAVVVTYPFVFSPK